MTKYEVWLMTGEQIVMEAASYKVDGDVIYFYQNYPAEPSVAMIPLMMVKMIRPQPGD